MVTIINDKFVLMNLIDDDCIQPSSEKIQEIETNVSSSEFTFTFIVTIIISVFVPGRSRDEGVHRWLSL